jgi:hypothetical protein
MRRNTAAGLGYAIAGEYVSMTGLHERAVPRSPPFSRVARQFWLKSKMPVPRQNMSSRRFVSDRLQTADVPAPIIDNIKVEITGRRSTNDDTRRSCCARCLQSSRRTNHWSLANPENGAASRIPPTIAMRTRSDRLVAAILVITLARYISTVR